jgi:uncharacterized damage-inducible protein DinB
MLNDVEAFIRFFHGQRRRTQWVVDAFPEERAEWSPWPGEMSVAEILCHIAAAHVMYATVIADDRWKVDSYEEPAASWHSAVAYFERQTERALDLIRDLPDSTLAEERHRPDDAGVLIPVWRLLMLMLEHEIHHRAQLECYLMLCNLRQPRLGALSVQAVREHVAGVTNELDEDISG